MDHHPHDLITDAEMDTALERSKQYASFPTIVEAVYRGEPELSFLMLRLSNGQRMFIPREMLGELRNATEEQAVSLEIGPEGLDIWWPKLDDGLYLPDFVEHRWGKPFQHLAA